MYIEITPLFHTIRVQMSDYHRNGPYEQIGKRSLNV